MPLYRMGLRTIPLLLMLASGMTMIAGASSVPQQSIISAQDSRDSPSVGTTIVDTVGDVPLNTKFKTPGCGGLPINRNLSIGPEFTLTQPMTITEIGGFIESCARYVEGLPLGCPGIPAVVVNVHPALKGSLNPSVIIASFSLSNDNDPSSISYESVQVSLRLGPGTYYAMFTNPDADGIVLQGANHPFEYKCKRGRMGQIQRSSGVVLTNEQLMAVRILGTVH